MSDYDTIQELRAELSRCNDAVELRQIEVELKACEARQAQQDAAFNTWMARLE